jgi:hypothetical protein
MRACDDRASDRSGRRGRSFPEAEVAERGDVRKQLDCELRIASAEVHAELQGAGFGGDPIDQEGSLRWIAAAMDGDQDVVVAFKVDLDAELAGGVALDGRLGKSERDDGGSSDFFRCREVFLHEGGRKREHAGNVVKAVTGIVDGKIGAGIEGDGEEIAHGGVIFVAIQAAGDGVS